MQSVAIIGAGPAALYSAEKLLKAGRKVTIFNRDIKAGGLAEFGIYPNKYKMKSGLRKVFTKILSHPNLTYFGNVTVGAGGAVSLDEIRGLGFDAVIVAVGAQGTKTLGLPGEDSAGVFHAKDLVYHYNALPPFSERAFDIGQRVCVVGIGNVSLDIVHWLVCEKKVESVTIVARRGPGERAYTDKEMEIVAGTLDFEALEAEFEQQKQQLEALGQDGQVFLAELRKQAEEPLECETPTRLSLRYFRSPCAIEKDTEGRICGLVCDVMQGELRGESVGVKATGAKETLACDTVVFAIGDSIEPGIGLPLSADGRTFAVVPEVWSQQPERDRYMVFDPVANAPMWGVFVAGWARKASDGLVGKARLDATSGCDEVLAWLDGGFEVKPAGAVEGVAERARELLREREVDFVEYADVQRLESAEAALAMERGLPEFKLTHASEMMARIRGEK